MKVSFLSDPQIESQFQTQRGFTLVELLVYMLISAIVATIAATAWFESAKFSIGSQKKAAIAEQVSWLKSSLTSDFELMGLSAQQIANSVSANTDVFWDAANNDFSSYDFQDNGSLDTIGFKVGVFDEAVEDGFQLISYRVSSGNLIRTQKNYASGGSAPTSQSSLTMASNVTEFDLTLGTYRIQTSAGDSLIDTLRMDPAQAGSDYLVDYGEGGDIIEMDTIDPHVLLKPNVEKTENSYELVDNGSRKVFSIEKGKTYTMRFSTVFTADMKSSFNVAKDSLVLSLKKVSDTSEVIDGVLPYRFYPGGVSGNEMAFDFSSTDTLFILQLKTTTSLISGASSASWSIGNFRLFENTLSKPEYYTALPVNAAEKLAVKVSTNLIKANIKLYETTGTDTVWHSSTLFLDLPNNGVRQ